MVHQPGIGAALPYRGCPPVLPSRLGAALPYWDCPLVLVIRVAEESHVHSPIDVFFQYACVTCAVCAYNIISDSCSCAAESDVFPYLLVNIGSGVSMLKVFSQLMCGSLVITFIHEILSHTHSTISPHESAYRSWCYCCNSAGSEQEEGAKDAVVTLSCTQITFNNK